MSIVGIPEHDYGFRSEKEDERDLEGWKGKAVTERVIVKRDKNLSQGNGMEKGG